MRYPKTAEALAVVRDGLIRFFPQHWEKVYAQWLENIQDWCISRQVWWGHRVPAWYGPEGKILVQIESPGEGWTQDPDTLDTWFSSWLWAYETMDPETRAKFYPTDVLVTGPDIIFFWVARMIIAGLEFQPGKSPAPEDNIPFRNVYFTGLIRDSKGKKMSKSLGNSPDVLDLIARFGADGVRFGLLRIAPQGQDIRFDEKQVEEGRNFANKIWNAARFYQMQEPALPFGTRVSYRPAPYVLDIESKLRDTQIAVEAAYKDFRFSEAAQRLYDFFWSDYCDWFVEAAKADIVGVESVQPGQRVTERGLAKHIALFTMYRVLTEFPRTAAPVHAAPDGGTVRAAELSRRAMRLRPRRRSFRTTRPCRRRRNRKRPGRSASRSSCFTVAWADRSACPARRRKSPRRASPRRTSTTPSAPRATCGRNTAWPPTNPRSSSCACATNCSKMPTSWPTRCARSPA